MPDRSFLAPDPSAALTGLVAAAAFLLLLLLRCLAAHGVDHPQIRRVALAGDGHGLAEAPQRAAQLHNQVLHVVIVGPLQQRAPFGQEIHDVRG